MSLSAGARLGPYELIASLGKGGMGEVFRARDTRLGRDVAVKVLPDQMTGDAQALARFEREARAVAALNHPNIVALFDVGREGPTSYAVSELLEGQTLRDRLASGPLPVRQALEYARTLADALAAAHDRGIVHRDLKPENVFLTTDGRLKVLDFGLAQVVPATTGQPGLDSAADSLTRVATSPGMVLGTVGYMAPEQVRGQATDARTDVFALGLLIYEMLTGSRAFKGDTAADAMSAVLHADPPDVSQSGVMVAPAVERILRRCLQKQPAQRFQSARDVSFAIEAVADGRSDSVIASAASRGSAPAVRARIGVLPLALAGAVAIGAIGGAFVAGRRTAPVSSAGVVQRFAIPSGVVTGLASVSISPDGRYLAYAAPGTGVSSNTSILMLRALDSLTARPALGSAPDASGSTYAFWSPDSRQLGYFGGRDLFAVDVPDGSPRKISTLPENAAFRRAAWGPGGVILATTGATMYRIPAGGGAPQAILKIDPARESSLLTPSFLADGTRFLYTVTPAAQVGGVTEIRAATIDGKVLGTITKGLVGGFYVDGHLVFGAKGGTYAQALDETRLALRGKPVQLAAVTMQDPRNDILFASASDVGTLAYRLPPNLDVQFTWVDRVGRRLSTLGPVGPFTNFDVSPDGSRIISAWRDPLTTQNVLWLIDALRGVASSVTPKDDDGYGDPTWMPDGEHIVFRYQRQLAMRLANGGERRVLLPISGYPDSVTRDGRFVFYGAGTGATYELFAIDILTPGAKPIPIVTGQSVADEIKIAPNGKWLAYHGNESGTVQVSVMPFPPTGEKWQISQSGGVQPRWSQDGQELFFLDLDGRMMSARLPDSDPRRASQPVALFSTGLTPSSSLDQFEPVKDRFLLRVPTVSPAIASPIGVVVNWKRLVAESKE